MPAARPATDARVALALFLRREGQFEQARDVVRTLARDHPKKFLFALEDGSLLKEENRNGEAAALRKVLSGCNEGKYPNVHEEMAWLCWVKRSAAKAGFRRR